QAAGRLETVTAPLEPPPRPRQAQRPTARRTAHCHVRAGTAAGPSNGSARRHMVRVPQIVRAKAITAGEAAWLDGLPALVSELADRWRIAVGQSVDDATEALVAEAMLANGMPAVLKIVIPRAGNHARNEITMLRLDAGRGCVRLLAYDEARGAMLLERLGLL